MYGNTLIYVSTQLPVRSQKLKLNSVMSDHLNLSLGSTYAISAYPLMALSLSSAYLSIYAIPKAHKTLRMHIKNPTASAMPNPLLS